MCADIFESFILKLEKKIERLKQPVKYLKQSSKGSFENNKTSVVGAAVGEEGDAVSKYAAAGACHFVHPRNRVQRPTTPSY